MKTIREVFADNLRELRGKMTQEEFSAKAGISLSTYQKMERGNVPQAENLRTLAETLKVPESRLFYDRSLAPKATREQLLLTLFEEALKLDDDSIGIVLETIRVRIKNGLRKPVGSLKNNQ